MFAQAITPQGDVRLAVRVGCSRQRANVVQRNGRHVSSAQAGGALQNPAYRLADILRMRGSARNTPDPSPIQATVIARSARAGISRFPMCNFNVKLSLLLSLVEIYKSPLQ